MEELLDDVLRKSLHSAQTIILSVLYSLLEQMMVDLLLMDLLGDILDAHIAKFFENEAAENKP